MSATNKILRCIICVLLSTLPFTPALAQRSKINQEKLDSIADAKAMLKDTIVPFLVNKVQTYSFVIKRDNNLVQRAVDMGNMPDNLASIQKRLTRFTKRMNQKGRKMNLRNLNSSTIMMKESLKQLNIYDLSLTSLHNDLMQSNMNLDKIQKDPLLQITTPDSSLNTLIAELKDDAQELDSTQKFTIAKIALIRNKVSLLTLQANDLISQLGYKTITLKREMWDREDELFFNDRPNDYDQSLLAIIANAMKRSGKNTLVFLSNKWNVITLAFIIFTLLTIWSLSNMRRVKKMEDAAFILAETPFLKRSVILSGIISMLICLPFFFATPQMSFLHITELLRLVTLSILIFPFLTKRSKPLWLLLCVIWTYYAIDDLLLESAYGERVMLLIMAVALAFICIRTLLNKQGNFKVIAESAGTKPITIFSLVLVILSIAFNLTGRITLAKIAGVSAVQCFVLGITLKVFSTIIIEAIFLQTEAYRESRFSDFINFKEFQHKLRKTLWLICGFVWFVSLLRSFTLYEWSLHMMGQFFMANRTVGKINFTYKSVAIFIGVIWLSSIISGFINFFFGHEKAVAGKKKIGSMMLLIRLAIWSFGFLLAFAAAGIPLDKISIMLGALGVGIGFGLQNIANNLVSGIILAFERPIQVGDQIEIGNKSGTVKEIGVRSSKIKSADGSDIIIPNGDLLSQHLINWTMKDTNKRIEFSIGVPYKADILHVKKIILQTLERNENILQIPAPAILLQAFADSALEVKISFWVPDLSKAGSIRSEVMISVYNALEDDGIELPYPIKKN